MSLPCHYPHCPGVALGRSAGAPEAVLSGPPAQGPPHWALWAVWTDSHLLQVKRTWRAWLEGHCGSLYLHLGGAFHHLAPGTIHTTPSAWQVGRVVRPHWGPEVGRGLCRVREMSQDAMDV
ncbi:hypothetical protein P7K49_021581 [Saguinus oedipus]|uniref:Uncharacterized protein n=1 Tax=Saguinus oedipus TaxID=9490 RepID=A0ABQ9UT08_SAGOE|nr:hypothetical protein P7K49_021581 [Saguinus oedipus]